MVETINKYIKISRQLLQEYGREPTLKEIAEEMGVPVKKVEEIRRVSMNPVSLEAPIGEEEDNHIGDFIPDQEAISPEDAACKNARNKALHEELGKLSEREEQVLRQRFGVGDGISHTLEEIGKELGVTRERIRQIETKALRKLRHPVHSEKLRDFVE